MAKRVKNLSTSEAAYLAGLIDGEGSITLSRKYRGENRQLGVSISNTDRRLLEWVLKVIGVGRVTNKATRSANHLKKSLAIIPMFTASKLAEINASPIDRAIP